MGLFGSDDKPAVQDGTTTEVDEGGPLDAAANALVGKLLDFGIDGIGPVDSSYEVVTKARKKYGDDVDRAIDEIVTGEDDFRQRVHAGLDRLVARVLQVEHIYRALLTARTQHEPTREMWDAGRRYNAEPVADFIRAERDAGRAPEGADAQALAEGLMQLNQLILERVVYEPVSLVQEYRNFDFLSPWEGMTKELPGDEKAEKEADNG